MRQTDNFALNLPEGQDNYSKNDYNENFKVIDEKMKYLADHISGGGGNYGTLNVTQNGTYTPTAPYDAYDEVVVNVSGGGEPTPTITVEPLTVTENGTYTAGENAAYNPVTVNVPSTLPNEYLESEFDLLHSNPTDGFLDSIKGHKLNTSSYRGFRNGYITDRDCFVQMNVPNEGDIKRVVVKTGEFDRSQEPNEEWLNIMRLNDNDWHFNLCFNNDDNYWRVSDESGATIDIPSSTLPKYSFENTTFEIVFGAKYINGVLYRGIKQNDVVIADYSERMFVYLNNTLVISNDRSVSPVFRVCGGNGWTGAKFENVKIYNVLDRYEKYYEAPVSLMTQQEETSSESEEVSSEEQPGEELIDEEKETDTKE